MPDVDPTAIVNEALKKNTGAVDDMNEFDKIKKLINLKLNKSLKENGYDENAQKTENYTASDTWIRLGYSKASKSIPVSFGISNQIYISKLENYNSTSVYSSFGVIWNLDKYNLDIGRLNAVTERLKSNQLTKLTSQDIRKTGRCSN